jgi:hypothetical protein
VDSLRERLAAAEKETENLRLEMAALQAQVLLE